MSLNRHVEGAVHRLELIRLVLHVDGLVHVLAVKVGVPGRLPQVELADVRGVQQLVPAIEMGVLPEVLDHVAHARSLGVPEHEAAAHLLLLDGEQVEFLANLAVVAPRRLRLEFVVCLHLLGVPHAVP